MRKVGDLFEFARLIRYISQRQPLFATGNYCHDIISESFYQSNDTDNDDEMFTMPHCEPQEDSDSDGNEQSHHTSVLSIIHGIMCASSDGVKWMPKHIALGSILHQATRSTLNISTSIAQVGPLTSVRYSLFLKEINGTVVLTDLNPDNFMQFTANNIDINDSLLGGKDTFHATQVPGW